jgi:hypothetical protein
MYWSQQVWRTLFDTLSAHNGADAFDDLLEPWLRLAEGRQEIAWLSDFQSRTSTSWHSANDEDLCRLYAIFRVASLLLLRFQTGRADGTDHPGPAISVEEYRAFFEGLGFHVPDVDGFHPFYHEIIHVRQSASPAAPVKVEDCAWPALMLGSMMFCRAGATVTAGVQHVDQAVAESSTLYWTYRRKDRRCQDQSQGWGSNSQWRTRLRRDYRTDHGYHFNVDAAEPLNDRVGDVDGIPCPAMIEIVRHRCLVTTKIDDSDLYPYRYSFEEND